MDADRLARVAAALADTIGTVALERLLGLCVDLLPVVGAGIAIVGDGQHRGSLAVSGPVAAAVDELQFALGEGPCITADGASGPVLESDLEHDGGLWPAFAPAALAEGVGSVFAFPLRVGPVHLGVLILYGGHAGDLGSTELADALTFAQIASHVLIDMDGHLPPGAVPERLADVVDHRAHVHQATGMVSAQLGVDVGVALARLRAFAWAADRRLDDVAREVIDRRLRFEAGDGE